MPSHRTPAASVLVRALSGAVLAAGLLVGVPGAAGAAATVATTLAAPGDRLAADEDGVVHPEVLAALRRQGRRAAPTVRVIVSLDVAGKVPQPTAVRSARAAVLGGLPASSYDVVARFDRIAAVSLEADAAALDALSVDPRVTAVSKDHVVSLQMDQANAITGADDVHTGGITGAGTRVAIIDSGVDSNAGVVHPGLADDLVAQACFRTENDCIGGAGSAEDQNGHGTHVAGIVTGTSGAAPDAQFDALKVFTDGGTSDTNILNALNHVIGLNSANPGTIDLVNMSLGGGLYANQSSCNAANTGYLNAFASLNSQGTTVFVATGNEAATDAVASPGCVSGAVGVGSTGDGVHNIGFSNCTDQGQVDKVSCYSNATPVQGAGELVDVLAPGCLITSAWLNNGTDTICGTSMASPYAAGVAALVLEAAADASVTLSPADLEQQLEVTGVQLADYRLPGGSPTFPRVNALDAVASFLIERPTGLVVTGSTSTSVALSWTPAAGATGYRVYRTSSAQNDQQIATPTSAGHVDSAPPCGPLSYVVRAVNGTAVSAPSNRVDVTARACPSPPASLTLTPVDEDTQTLSWTDPNPDETSAELQRRRANGTFATVQTLAGEGTARQLTDSVSGCGLVEYRVVVLKGSDTSQPSPVAARGICAPANDDRADAESVTPGANGTSQTDTETAVSFATEEPDDPAFSCRVSGSGTGFEGIWYRIQPSSATTVTIGTTASTLVVPSSNAPDTLVAVYEGSPSLANEVACDDDISSQNYRSQVTVELDAGAEYYVHVAQWGPVPEGTTGTVATEFSWDAEVLQPDARIKKGVTGTLVGNDIYGTPTGQTRSAKVERGKKVTFVASLQNDGEAEDTFDLIGGSGSNAITVVYKTPAGVNVTSQVTAGTFPTPSLAPAETYDLTVVVRVKSTARVGASITRSVVATSQGDVTADDLVVFKVTRK